MPTTSIAQLPKSKSAEEFEELCLDILILHYSLSAKRYGRSGQAQNGIDIYAHSIEKPRTFIVAQCKNYLKSDSSNELIKKIEDDINSAIAQKSIQNISCFYVMTAHNRDVNLQNFILKKEDESPFCLEILFWDDIEKIVLQNETLKQRHFSSFNLQLKPNIKIRAIHGESLNDTAYIEPFITSKSFALLNRLEEIRDLFTRIACIQIWPKENNECRSIYSPIALPNSLIDTLIRVAESINFCIPQGFFELGGLQESVSSYLPVYIGGGQKLIGSNQQIQKYKSLILLDAKIRDFASFGLLLDCFSELSCIKLVVCNDGSSFDEDIDIQLDIPQNRFLHYKSFCRPNNSSLRLALETCYLNEIFKIHASPQYIDFDSTWNPTLHPTTYVPITPFSTRNYVEEYDRTMDDIFEYKFYEVGESVLVKLHIDYIKQHTSVAFPTPIFINTDKPLTIKYSVNSRGSVDIIRNTIVANTLVDVDIC